MAVNYLLIESKELQLEPEEPPQYPPTILDLERSNYTFDMFLQLADPCPACGAFNLRVGDYVSFGMCGVCIDEAYANH